MTVVVVLCRRSVFCTLFQWLLTVKVRPIDHCAVFMIIVIDHLSSCGSEACDAVQIVTSDDWFYAQVSDNSLPECGTI